jgi:hypothetical protein
MTHPEGFDHWQSKTYSYKVGCGKLFVTIISDEGQIVRVITHRKSVFDCDLTFFDALNRQTSFQTNRELEQTIKDLRGNDMPKEGHFCRKYGIAVKSALKRGDLAGYSCADAVARALENETKEKTA